MQKIDLLKPKELLTSAEMRLAKGGATTTDTSLTLTATLTATDTTYSVTLDDKRRARPGGGVTTL